MAKWTIVAVAARLAEAVETGRRLPPVRVQGYFNVWPALVREAWETYPEEDHVCRLIPPSPKAIDRMMETMRWVVWLELEQRHLVWMRAKNMGWKMIARRLACHRSTAWRAWQVALTEIANKLNSSAPIGRIADLRQESRRT